MKTEWNVVIALVGMLLVLEGGVRLFERRLSKDVEHMLRLPESSSSFSSGSPEVVRVLVIGNSLARCGLDEILLRDELQESLGKQVVVVGMHPDGSRIEEWAFGYRRYFAEPRIRPHWVLMLTGQMHLTDGLQNVTGMGAFFVAGRDVWRFISGRLSGLEQRVAFFAARYSRLFAHRKRVEPLLFYGAVPCYEKTAQAINDRTAVPIRHGGSTERQETWEVFCDFIDELRKEEVSLVVATVPMPEPYSLNRGMVCEMKSKGVMFVSRASETPWPVELFSDGYHLNPEGAEKFTREILEVWKP